MDAAGLAITLSGTVLKLVVFSLDFISDVKQIHKHGAIDRNVDLSTVAESVALVTTSLEDQLSAASEGGLGGSQQLDADDLRLKNLSMRAAEIGRELTYKLSKVTTDKKSTWKSFKAAALGMWDSDDIERTEKRLNAIKDEIQFNILVGIRNKVNQTNDDGNSQILATLEEVAGKQARSKEDSAHMIELLSDADRTGQGRHEELIQLGNHLLHAIRALSNPTSPLTHTPPPLASTYPQDNGARQAAENMVLVSLWYPSKYDREETIDEAYRNTFQWIFEDPAKTGNQWSNFVDFLQGETPSYWVTGKPGSGKSTLMKYINEAPKTKDYLRQWAGEKALIRASHYFYYSGTDNEKTEIGLFKSLLHSILDERRDLIPIAFNDRFQAALEGKKHEDPSLPEAKRALMNLIRRSLGTCYFFSIDGLDEFDPDISMTHVQSLIDFTHLLESCPNVKILVSSRPLPEFERAYDGRAFLRVQDLTRGDIRRYAQERLMGHPRMSALEKKDPETTSSLLDSIVDSSLGVFLWVRLVVDSLIEGLTNYEGLDDLRKTLQELPSDLHALYSTILRRIKPNHKPKAARLLSIVHCVQRYEGHIALLDLWFAENADSDMVQRTPIRPISDEDHLDRVRELENCLKSHCLGLIETGFEAIPSGSSRDYRDSYVRHPPNGERILFARFLHRSVFEFLNHGNTLHKQLSHTFSPALCLFRSIVLLIKTYRPYLHVTWRKVIGLGRHAGLRALRAEQETQQPHQALIHELDLAMHGIMPLIYDAANAAVDPDMAAISLPHRDYHWWTWCRFSALFVKQFNSYLHKGFIPLYDESHGSLLAFAAECGLTFYVQHQIAREGREVLRKQGLPLLGYALMPMYSRTSNEMVRLLLDEGSDPNEIYNGTSVWEWHLWTMYRDNIGYGHPNRIVRSWINAHRVETLEVMLSGGANPHGRMTRVSRSESMDEEIDMSQLPWFPQTSFCKSTSVCTLLLALVRENQFLQGILDKEPQPSMLSDQVYHTIPKLIVFLQEHGAVEEEWKNHDDIKRIFLDIYRRMTEKDFVLLGNDSVPKELREENVTKKTTCDVSSSTTTPDTADRPKLSVDSIPPDVTVATTNDNESTILGAEKDTRQAELVSSNQSEIKKQKWRMRYDEMIRNVQHRIRRTK